MIPAGGIQEEGSRAMKARVSVGFAHWAVLAVAALVFGPTLAHASRLSEVRVGTHPGFTRIVLELDGPAGYRLHEPKVGAPQELVMEIDASSSAQQVTSRSPLVGEVRVEPSTRGSTVRIPLKRDDVHVTEMILAKPTRIVLDVRRFEAAAIAPPKAATGAPPAKLDTTPSAAAAKAGTSAPAASAGLPDLAPAELEKAAAAALGETKAARSSGTAKAAEPAQKAEVEAAAAKLPAAAGPEQSEPPSGAVQVASAGSGEDDPFAGMPLPGPEQGAAPAPSLRADAAPGSARPPVPSSRAAPSTGSSGGVPGFLTAPKGIVAVVAGIVILVLVWLRLRRREDDSEPLTASILNDEDFAMSMDSEPTAAESAAPELHAESVTEFDANSDFETSLEPAPRTAAVAPAPGPARPAAEGGRLDALERRLVQLESRCEELTQARERLERQVAAQTEELRVQRSAIARTQRALRSLAKPGAEEPTEPVPKG